VCYGATGCHYADDYLGRQIFGAVDLRMIRVARKMRDLRGQELVEEAGAAGRASSAPPQLRFIGSP
jgi:hypothetical protein